MEQEPRTFANTPSSELLCRGAGPWCDAIIVYGSVYQALAELPRAARTREPMFERVAGADWWTFLERNPALGEAFNRLMQAGAQERVELIADLEWRDGATVVDVGAGNGTLLIELLQRRPTLRGVVFDLPEVVREAQQRIDAAGLSERCRIVAGSFFDSVPPDGDALHPCEGLARLGRRAGGAHPQERPCRNSRSRAHCRRGRGRVAGERA